MRALADTLLPRQEGTSGKTALHLAVETHERGLVQFLLQAGARVDARMLNGCTPLHLAAGRGLRSISSTLCEAGADSLLRNVEDETPQDLAEDVRGRHSALLSRTSLVETGAVIAERVKELGAQGVNHGSAAHQLWDLGQASAPLAVCVLNWSGPGAQTWTPTGAVQLKRIREAGWV